MSVVRLPESSLRAERAEINRLAWAFAISLLLHALIFGTYQAGQKFGWWQSFHWPAWLQSNKMLGNIFKKKNQPSPPIQQELPLVFIDVSPEQATPEPPKEAKFYSNKNSQAANPDPSLDTNTPKIDGKQTDVPKTQDVPREKFAPLQPSAPQQPEEKAKPTETPGDLVMAKPSEEVRKDEGDKPHTRPKTVREALARIGAPSRLAGEKMKQEGGVRRRLSISSVDAKASLFGDYDYALIEAIQTRWFGLLDERDYASDSRGKVVLQFRLHYDGRITDMSVSENTAGEVLGHICQRAVMDPAPFMAWTMDMRRMLGDIRNIQFTFYYN
jgi:hypothetical protein